MKYHDQKSRSKYCARFVHSMKFGLQNRLCDGVNNENHLVLQSRTPGIYIAIQHGLLKADVLFQDLH